MQTDVDLVNTRKLEELTGITQKMVKNYKYRGEWLEGKHYFMQGRKSFYSLSQIQEWMRGVKNG